MISSKRDELDLARNVSWIKQNWSDTLRRPMAILKIHSNLLADLYLFRIETKAINHLLTDCSTFSEFPLLNFCFQHLNLIKSWFKYFWKTASDKNWKQHNFWKSRRLFPQHYGLIPRLSLSPIKHVTRISETPAKEGFELLIASKKLSFFTLLYHVSYV